MSDNGMEGDNRSASIGESADSSAIQTGDGNTATITNYYYYYREVNTVVSVESTDAKDDNLLCPYRGLFHFGPDHAEYFFGREVFVEELFTATQTRNFIPLLGASGSGKSSVVLAGLVPKLQKEGNWLFTHFRPGKDPFHALALALIPLYTKNLNDTEKIIQARQLSQSLSDAKNPLPLGDIFAQIHQNNPTYRVLLIADQFEEIYTLCADNKVRHRFLDALLETFPSSSTQSQYNRVLVATMRADFLGNALEYPSFRDVLKDDIKLSSMNHDELTSIIAKPAEKLKVTFESGLVERILDDVKDEPGNLPLLEFALTELWKQRKDRQLTHAAYQKIGKVQGALARHADWNYGNLDATQKEQVRRIFIQLVQPGEGTLDTRRLATKAELGETSWNLVKQLADNRLVVTNQNAANQETVEVVHEALISNWDEFRRWMNEDRSFRAWQERLRFAMAQWQNNQADKELLLRGKVLAEAEEKLKQRRDELSADEQKFIQASVALRQRRKGLIYSGLGVAGSIFLIWIGFLGWRDYTTPGQLTHIRWKLTDASELITNPSYQSKAAIAFAKNENFDRAFEITDKIKDSHFKVDALRAIAEVYAKISEPQKAASLLEQAIKSADNISYSRNKASALSAIAEVIAKISEPQKAASLLEQAIKSAENISATNIPVSQFKASALIAIAEVIAKISEPQKAASLLEQAIKSADNISDSDHKVKALSAIAEVYAKREQPRKAASLLEQAIKSVDNMSYSYHNHNSYYKASALIAIAEVIAKISEPQKAASLLEQAIKSADNISDSDHKVKALSAIAEVYAKREQPRKAASLLEQAIKSVDNISDSDDKAKALSAIAEVYAKREQPQKAALLLEQAIKSANNIFSSRKKSYALSAIAGVYAKLSKPQKAASLLEQAIKSADNISDYHYKGYVLRTIAEVIAKISEPQKAASLLEQAIKSADNISQSGEKAEALGAIAEVIAKISEPQKAASLLEQAIKSADNISQSGDKAEALSAIAEVAAKYKNWGLALEVTNKCRSEYCKVKSLTKVLTIHAEQKNPELK